MKAVMARRSSLKVQSGKSGPTSDRPWGGVPSNRMFTRSEVCNG